MYSFFSSWFEMNITPITRDLESVKREINALLRKGEPSEVEDLLWVERLGSEEVRL